MHNILIRISNIAFLGLCFLVYSEPATAQGQDSTTWERDRQVIATLLNGHFSNANQAYFDHRAGRLAKHRPLEVAISDPAEDGFAVTGNWTGGGPAFSWSLTLASDDEVRAVRMHLESGDERCDYLWYREAAQFRARPQSCGDGFPGELVLSEQQFWVDIGAERGGNFELHRARAFKCHADIPGVGGGAPIPYDRYGEFELHDQGGSAWFTSREGREIGISLLNVDWPLNNYHGVFTRDSFVMYLTEKVDGERKELGYAFTHPEADRIGMNLKWILVLCYMTSNRDATPSM